jgi:hypothetical protein
MNILVVFDAVSGPVIEPENEDKKKKDKMKKE